MTRRTVLLLPALFHLLLSLPLAANAAPEPAWPPTLKGAAKNGTVTLTSQRFLEIPEAVKADIGKEGVAPFVLAKTPPTVDLACHGDLPNAALNGTGWSAWGDIGVASDGKVYSGIGDHGNAVGGESFCFIYQWDPATKTLKQVVDVNRIVERHGEPTWSKVHARIDEGADGKIYFACTLNDGNRANRPEYKWSSRIPGAQLYAYDPATGTAEVVTNLPPARATATSLMDRKRNTWWCNLEAGPNALFAIDLTAMKVAFKAPDGSMKFNRNFALAADGSVYFNGTNGIWRANPVDGSLTQTRSSFPSGAGMRSSTRESSTGHIYGVAHRPGRLFRYTPAADTLELLGPDFLTGGYTTVCVLSADERFLYYLTGAHGQAFRVGTPVVQYDIAKKQRKVLAFLGPAFEEAHQYVPGGTYGMKLSADDATLYVNFNGHAADAIRPEKMRANGFGLTAFAAIHIPQSER